MSLNNETLKTPQKEIRERERKDIYANSRTKQSHSTEVFRCNCPNPQSQQGIRADYRAQCTERLHNGKSRTEVWHETLRSIFYQPVNNLQVVT